MKQLHYQAQKYLGDARIRAVSGDLRNNAAPRPLMHDDILSATSGDGSGRDAWAAMDIPPRPTTCQHRPCRCRKEPIAPQRHEQSPASSHDATASLVVYNTHDYELDQHLVWDHALYEIDLTGALSSSRTSRSMCCLPC